MVFTYTRVGGQLVLAPYSTVNPTTGTYTDTSSSVILNLSGPFTSYNLTRTNITAGNTTTNLTGLTNKTNTDTGLTANTNYSYQIVPISSIATGNPVNLGSTWTFANVTLAAPTINANNIAFTWSGNYSYLSISSTSGDVSANIPSGTTTWTDTGLNGVGLTGTTAYSYTITAYNGAGASGNNVWYNGSYLSGALSLTTVSSYNMSTFTNITGKTVTTPAAFTQLALATANTMSISMVLVNQSQSKMIFGSDNGVYWSTSSDGGTTWLAPTLVSGSLSTLNVGGMSADGTRIVVTGINSYWYYIAWSNATGAPSALVKFTDSPTNNRYYCAMSMTPDGTKVVCAVGNSENPGGVYYAYWNGSGFTMGGSPFPGVSSSYGYIHFGCAIYPDATGVLVAAGNNNHYFLPITWSGNTPTAGSWQQSDSATLDARGICFLGGGSNSTPSYILCSTSGNNGSGPMYLATWNNTTKTAGTLSTTYAANGSNGIGGGITYFGGQVGWTPCGPNGNILYFIEDYTNGAAGTKFNISKVTFTVS